MPSSHPKTGIIVVDHGSRLEASNRMLHEATQNFAAQSDFDIVEPAHMELAQPDIAAAFRKCVDRGAKRVVVFPYFLSPGRHWSEDIPRLAAEAAEPFSDVEWVVTAPFGLHPDMCGIIEDRIQRCVAVAEAKEPAECDVCGDGQSCQWSRA